MRLLGALLLVAIAALLHASPAAAQSQGAPGAVAYLRDSTAVTGAIVAIDREKIIIEPLDEVARVVPLESIRSLVLIEPKRSGVGALVTLACTYTAAAIGALNTDPSGGVYLPDNDEEALFAGGMGLIVGGIAGSIAEPERTERRIELDMRDAAGRDALVARVSEAISPRRSWRVMVHGGRVFGSAREVQGRALYDARPRLPNADPFELDRYPYTTRVFPTTLLRRVEVSYDLAERGHPSLDAAATLVSLAQPGSFATLVRYDTTWDRGAEIIGVDVREGYTGLGLFAGGHYLAPLDRDGLAVVRLGVLAGLASSRLIRNEADFMRQVDPAALGSIELLLTPVDLLTIGVAVDYLAVPSVEIPYDRGFNIPGSTMNLSSAGIGFVIGTRF
jgi:hypothetical protein